MHRIELKLKTGETVHVGTMSSFEFATELVKAIWRNGYQTTKLDEIEAIHLTTYLGSK